MTSDLELIRSEFLQAKENGHGIDPDVAVRLVDALAAVEVELLLLRSVVSDLDELMDGEEGPLFQPDHSCRVQRRMAQWYREIYKPNAEQRGHRKPGQTFGRGRGVV